GDARNTVSSSDPKSEIKSEEENEDANCELVLETCPMSAESKKRVEVKENIKRINKKDSPKPRPKIRCKFCRSRREEGAQMAQHVSAKHANYPQPEKTCRDIMCDYRTNDVQAMADHIKLPHAVSLFNSRFPKYTRCPYCALYIWNLAQFKAHIADKHKHGMGSEIPFIICAACSFKCARVFEMVQHWNEQSGRCELGMTFDYEKLKEFPCADEKLSVRP
ncbi:hypothetical protein PFISCL1PPCAC_4411, partial [Pristionchus fissidentatus]